MFGLFKPSSLKKRSDKLRGPRLRVESLEERNCPSGFISLQETQLPGTLVDLSGAISSSEPTTETIVFTGVAPGQTAVDASGNFDLQTEATSLGVVTAAEVDSTGAVLATSNVTIASSTPSLTLTASFNSNNTVVLSGQVTDDQPGGLTVSFSGAVNGTAVTDADGNFSLQTTVGSSGYVDASTINVWGLASNTASVWVSAPPSLTLAVSYGANGVATLTGQVSDDQPSGLTVSVSGAANGTAVTDGNGNFSLATTVGSSGDVTATVTDDLGMTSSPTSVWVSAPPSLTLAVSYSANGVATLTGQVSDDQPSGLTVSFSGAANGTAVTDSNGNFSMLASVGGSGDVTATVTDGLGMVAGPVSVWVSAPPSLALSVSYGANNVVILSGQVNADQPSGLTVSFSGAVSGSAVTDGNGYFSLQTSVSSSGYVNASAIDDLGQNSNIASVWASAPPSLTLAVAYGTQQMVTLSGQVSDDQPGGLTVTFTGAVTGSVVTNSDGTYSLTIPASSLGAVQASVTDSLGLVSNTATVTLACAAPVIANASVTRDGDNDWMFTGTVVAQDPDGLTVTFGGMSAVAGLTETTEPDGYFCLVVQLPAGETGTVTAQTTDWWGQTSATVDYFVS
jgi:hypothetical protein